MFVSDTTALIWISALTVIIGLAVAWSVRNIPFLGCNTDNQKLGRIAASSANFFRPSVMYSSVYSEGGHRTTTKEAVVLGLALMQQVLRNRDSDFPLIFLCLVANSVSSIFIFLLASEYWSTEAGLLAWALYTTGLVTYQTVLFGSPISLSQVFFLASLFTIHQADGRAHLGVDGWLVGAGVLAALTFLSSPSSRKYFPLLIVGFIYSQRAAFWEDGFTLEKSLHINDGIGIATIALAVALALGAMALKLSYSYLIKMIYAGRAPRLLNQLIPPNNRREEDRYIERAGTFVGPVTSGFLIIAAYLVISSGLANSTSFLWSQFSLVMGFSAVMLWITYPNVPKHLMGHYRQLQGWKFNRLPSYYSNFTEIGKSVTEYPRGGGIVWIVRYYWRVAPVPFLVFGLALFLALALFGFSSDPLEEAWQGAGILSISLLTLLLAEFTRSTQYSRTYFPNYVGFLIFIVYVAFRIDENAGDTQRAVFWSLSALAVLVSGLWTAKMYFKDVYPTRMAPTMLHQALQARDIKEFYAYDTPFNDAFIDNMMMYYGEKYRLQAIESLSEISTGYLVIAGTTAKSVNMSGSKLAREHGDFNPDPELNRLIESRKIERYAVASFETVSSSRFWVQENEISTYRDLVLQEIDDDDRWRGKGWVIDVAKFRLGEPR